MDDDLDDGDDDLWPHHDDNDVDDRHHHNDNEAPQGCLVANGEVVKHGGRALPVPRGRPSLCKHCSFLQVITSFKLTI